MSRNIPIVETVARGCSVKKMFLQLCFKKTLWHRCFAVNFAKFLKNTIFLQNTPRRLLLTLTWYEKNKKLWQNGNPVDTGRKLNKYKTFRRNPGRLLNILCSFNLSPVSTGNICQLVTEGISRRIDFEG